MTEILPVEITQSDRYLLDMVASCEDTSVNELILEGIKHVLLTRLPESIVSLVFKKKVDCCLRKHTFSDELIPYEDCFRQYRRKHRHRR